MTMSIQISYDPIAPTRRSHTTEIAAALRALKANPVSPEGQPGSFLIPAKHRSAALTAAVDVGVEIRTRTERDDQVRVMLK